MKEKRLNEEEETGQKSRSFLSRALSFRISTKVSLIFSALFLALCVVLITASVVVMENAMKNRAKADVDQAAALVFFVEEDSPRAELERRLEAIARTFRESDMRVEMKTPDGYVWRSDGEIEVASAIDYAIVSNVMTKTFEKNGVRVTIAYHLVDARNALTINEIIISACVLVSLILMLLVGSLSAKAVTRPIRKMTETTRLITTDALDTRLSTQDAHDELNELAEVINNMLDNLQVTIESQERFVSDASHEMRTPIAVIKGYASMLQRWGTTDREILNESIDAIAKEVDNMQRLIDNLLFLSRTDRDVLQVKFEPFALSEVVDEALREAEMVDPDHIYTVGRMEVTDVAASHDMIKQLLRIIAENARKYTPKGGTITFECYQEDRFAVMSVRDQGIGIAKKDLDHIFDRFYRADKARKRSDGSGLGMSIAKKIADAHGGEIILESKIGEGTLVTVYLPREREENV